MSNSRYDKIYKSLPTELKSRVKSITKWKSRRYKRNYETYYFEYFDDALDFKNFVEYIVDGLDHEEESELYHNRNYWYDAKEDKYIIYVRNKKRPLVLLGSYWRSIKESYSNWNGKPNSINESLVRGT